MEQRLRLVQSSQSRSDKRSAERRPVRLPAQIVWKDARGTTRMAAVVTRDISEHGVSVECQGGTPIPLFRMVYFQIDRDVRHRTDVPAPLRKTNVLSAIFRVGACSQSTGAPTEYALRLLIEPERRDVAGPAATWQSQAGTMTA
jgi:hypothetical protein